MSREIGAKFVEVTPKMATEWLARNKKNRRLKSDAVVRYAADMVADRWVQTGSPIVFNGNGDLIDGQHRLAAIIQANRNVRLLVVEGAPSESFAVMDSGVNRSPQDMLVLSGFEWTNYLATLCRFHITKAATNATQAFFINKGRVSTAAIIKYAEKNESWLMNSIKAISGIPDVAMSPIPLSLLMILYSLVAPRDRDEAIRFSQAVATGVGCEDGSAATLLRRNLHRRNRTERLSRRQTAALLIKAWNMHITGARNVVLNYREGEDFPEVASSEKS